MWYPLKSGRYLTGSPTLLILVIFVIICTSCEDGYDQYGKFLAEREQIYLEQVAKVFKEHKGIGYSSTGMEHIEFFQKMSAIEPPSHFKSRHDNLIDIHILNGNVKLHIERLEPWEQEQWKRQGSDDVARCSNVMEDWSLPANSEYQLACRVLWTARKILLHEMSNWEIVTFQVYGGDPYDLRD